MEENKRRKNIGKDIKKFNVLDVIIIVAVAFVATIALMLTIPKIQHRAKADEKTRISYSVTFYDVDANIVEQLSISNGQTVTDAVSGIALGKVDGDKQIEEAYCYALNPVADENGNYTVVKQKDVLGKTNITVTIEADAVYSEGKGYEIDGYRIAIGKEMQMRFPNYMGTGVCTGFEILAND